MMKTRELGEWALERAGCLIEQIGDAGAEGVIRAVSAMEHPQDLGLILIGLCERAAALHEVAHVSHATAECVGPFAVVHLRDGSAGTGPDAWAAYCAARETGMRGRG